MLVSTRLLIKFEGVHIQLGWTDGRENTALKTPGNEQITAHWTEKGDLPWIRASSHKEKTEHVLICCLIQEPSEIQPPRLASTQLIPKLLNFLITETYRTRGELGNRLKDAEFGSTGRTASHGREETSGFFSIEICFFSLFCILKWLTPQSFFAEHCIWVLSVHCEVSVSPMISTVLQNILTKKPCQRPFTPTIQCQPPSDLVPIFLRLKHPRFMRLLVPLILMVCSYFPPYGDTWLIFGLVRNS